jgi:DNA (cytosine-5)-methyltransferase 1
VTRPPLIRARFENELVVDNFAGGGGASTGIEAAIGRPVDLAINHDPVALAMHRANHPETRHACENITEVDPREACGGRPVGLAWFSPDCKHFSRSKGGKPRDSNIRGLAWVVVRWAREVKPRIICLENVEEFQTWGPLGDDGQPIKAQMGETFRAWLGALSDLGYQIEFRSMVAADYGTPTTRKRLFLIARRDGGPLAWPEATHGPGRERYRPAAEVIDWSLPCPSIFERKRPLAEKTLRRIALGIQRYVIDTAEPFLVPMTHHPITEPLRTVTAAHRGGFAFVAPSLIQTGYGERKGQAPRALDIQAPLGTVVAGGQKHGLVAALITKHYGGVVGHSARRALGTVTAKDHHAVSAAFLTRPGSHHGAEVRAFLAVHTPEEPRQQSLLEGGIGRATGLVMVAGEQYEIADIGMRMLQPHELFAAQGFPADYEIRPEYQGKQITKTAQVRLAGNSVCPPVARALVAELGVAA